MQNIKKRERERDLKINLNKIIEESMLEREDARKNNWRLNLAKAGKRGEENYQRKEI